MKTFKLLPLVVVLAAAACGSNTAASVNAFKSNAPTYDKFSIAQNDSNDVEPSSAQVAVVPSPALVSQGGDQCHPHLFANTDEVIGRINFHFAKLTRHVEEAIAKDPATANGNTQVFESVRDGIDRRLTVTATANGDGSTTYAFKLELAVAGTTETFTQVMNGSITHSGPADAEVADAGASDAGTAVAVETKGNVTFDFDALHSVVTTEQARGQLSDQFDNVHDPVKGVKRTATITLTNFVPDDRQAVVHGPRNGQYTWEREPDVGGFFQYQDSFILQCPANPTSLVSDVQAVARWYKAADGSVHGRSDAQATGGQIPAGDKWEGLTCAQGSRSVAPFEGEWMMKEEDSTGASIFFANVQIGLTPCDPIFGPVPDQNDSTNDYDFTKPVSFPNEF
jgi:hypothetical protein